MFCVERSVQKPIWVISKKSKKKIKQKAGLLSATMLTVPDPLADRRLLVTDVQPTEKQISYCDSNNQLYWVVVLIEDCDDTVAISMVSTESIVPVDHRSISCVGFRAWRRSWFIQCMGS